MRDLRKWAIAYTSLTEGYVGEVVCEAPGSITLSPAYALTGGYMAQQGRVGRVRMILPVEMLADVARVTVYPVSTLSLQSLSDADFKELSGDLERGIAEAEEVSRRIRSARSGILTASQMPTGKGFISR